MPDPQLLSTDERTALRQLLAGVRGDLLKGRKGDDVRSMVEAGLLGASGVGWWLGIAALEPFTLVGSVIFLARNEIENRKWKARKAAIETIADRLPQLV